MLRNFLKQLKSVIPQTLGCLLLVLAMLLCLTGCASSQAVVVPQQKAQVPKSLLEKALPDAEDFCKRVQDFLTRLVSDGENAPQTKTH